MANPPSYPLRGVPAKHEYGMLNPTAKLSDPWLRKDHHLSLEGSNSPNLEQEPSGYANTSVLVNTNSFVNMNMDMNSIANPNIANTITNVNPNTNSSLSSSTNPLVHTSPKSAPQNLQHNINSQTQNRKRKGDTHVDDEDSNDDMLLSDTDMSVSVSLALIHPPKRRLMSVLSPVTALTPTFPDQHHQGHRRTSDVSHGTTTILDVDEQPLDEAPQLLPLPSPSASPIHSSKNDMASPVESLLMLVPQSQGDMVELLQSLASFLSEKNQTHLIFTLLQNVKRAGLSSLNDVINGALRRDFLSDLPLEITKNILRHLDFRSVYNVSLTCKKWHNIVSSSRIWVELLRKDVLMELELEIEQQIANPDTLIREWSTGEGTIDIPQLLYKKRYTIYNRWMDPLYEPRRISIKVPSPANNVVTCLQHDDDKIITGVDDRLINVYDTKTGALLKVLKGHEGGVWALKYTGNTLVSGATDRTVRIWNIKTGKCTHIFKGHTSTVRCLDILKPEVIGRDDTGNDIIFPKEPLLVTGSRDHNLNVWKLPIIAEDEPDTEDEAAITYDSIDPHNPYLVKVLVGHTQSVRSVSGFGNLIVSGSYDGTVRVWDLLEDGNCVQMLAGHADRIYSTVLDYHNKICYSGSMDSTINVWNVETGALLHTLRGHGSLVGLLELSKDYLVSAAADSTLRVWDPNSGENLSTLEGHSAAITCFQHDLLRIVSGSERMLKLWDIRKGKFVKDILADVTGGIWQVRFDFNRCVAAVQRNVNERQETFIEILDYSSPPNQV